MERPDLDKTLASVREDLGGVRETLFAVAEDARPLAFSGRPNDLLSLLQRANYALGEAERELSSH